MSQCSQCIASLRLLERVRHGAHEALVATPCNGASPNYHEVTVNSVGRGGVSGTGGLQQDVRCTSKLTCMRPRAVVHMAVLRAASRQDGV
jgi:hypothetical protein